MRTLLIVILFSLAMAVSCNRDDDQNSGNSVGHAVSSTSTPLTFTQYASMVLEGTQYQINQCTDRVFVLSGEGQLQELGRDGSIQQIADDVRNVASHRDELAYQKAADVVIWNLSNDTRREFDLSQWLPTTVEFGMTIGVQQLFVSDTSILLDAELDSVQILLDLEREEVLTRQTKPLTEHMNYMLIEDSVLGVTNSLAQTDSLDVTIWDGEQTISTVLFRESSIGPNWPYFKNDAGGQYIYFADNITYDWTTQQSGLMLQGATQVYCNTYDPIGLRNWCWADGKIVSFKEGQQEVFAEFGKEGAELFVTHPWLVCLDKEELRQYDLRSGDIVRTLTMDLPEPKSWPMNGVLLDDGSCYLNYFQKGVWRIPALSGSSE